VAGVSAMLMCKLCTKEYSQFHIFVIGHGCGFNKRQFGRCAFGFTPAFGRVEGILGGAYEAQG